jgi:hypothetical protein
MITKEYYLANRSNMTYQFMYDVYLDTNPKRVLDFNGFIHSINQYLMINFSNINNLVSDIVSFYDNHFEIRILTKGDKILKIW